MDVIDSVPVTGRAWQVLVVTSLAAFVAAMDLTIVIVAFPAIAETFAAPPSDVSWVINAYTITFGGLLVPAGRVADRVGRKRTFVVGIIVFTVASVMCAFAPTMWSLVAARAVQAVGAAAIVPASLALTLAEFPVSKRATAVGIWGAAVGVSAAVGPPLAALIMQISEWPWIFLINLVPGAATVFAAVRTLRESTSGGDAGGAPADAVGATLQIVGVGLLLLAVTQSEAWGWRSARLWAVAAAGTVAIAAFVRRSRWHPAPVLDVRLFRITSFRVANLASVTFMASFAAFFFTVILFLSTAWGYSPARAGAMFTPGPLTVAVVGAACGRVADRHGHRAIMVPGGIVFAAGALWWATALSAQPNMAVWWSGLLVTGVGIGLVMPALASAAVHDLPARDFAVGSAANQAIRQVALGFGIAVVVAVTGTAPSLAAFRTLLVMVAAGSLATSAVCWGLDTRRADRQALTVAT